jgi:hypothetical protein
VGAFAGGRLDLVDDRRGEVGAGDPGGSVLAEERDFVAGAIPTRALARREGAVLTGRADEQPIETLRGGLGEGRPGRLALERLGAILLRNLALGEPWCAGCRPQRTESTDLDEPGTGLMRELGKAAIELDESSGIVGARGPRPPPPTTPRSRRPRPE